MLIRYLTSAIGEENRDTLKETFKKAIDKGDSIMPSIAEAWVNEGIEKGIEKGIERGIEKGIWEGIEKTAIKMLDMNMSIDDICKITGLSEKRIKALKRKKR